MRRIAVLSVLVLLAACAAPQEAARHGNNTPREVAISLETLADSAVCQVGPDDGPVAPAEHAGTSPAEGTSSPQPLAPQPLAPRRAETWQADRGIGGTGAPLTDTEPAMNQPANSQRAERGIGGTGIGDTGIVGVITGFASICVNGLEVAYDGSATVDIDGTPGTPSALRAGQIVMIQTTGSTATPVAQTISVRRQVIGRIDSIELGTGTLMIAGQAVSVPVGTWGAVTARLGDWVAVSGLRRTDGMLIASRLDRAPAGPMTVRGQVVREGDNTRIGDLVLDRVSAAELNPGQYVTVSGQYTGEHAQIRAVTPDPLFDNPAHYFGASVKHLVLQAFVRVANGTVYLNGLKVAAGPNISGPNISERPGADGAAIVSLERRSDGSFIAVGLRYADHGGSASSNARPPAGTSRTTPPQARRPAAQTMAVTGNSSSSGAGPTVSTMAKMSGPVGTSPDVTTISTGAMSIDPATTPMPPVTIANAPATSTPPPPVIVPSPLTIITPSVGSGARIESVTPNTSQLMSGLTGSNNAARPASVVHAAAVHHRAFVGAATGSATVSLATEAVTTPAAPNVAGSARTPAVSAPSSKSKPTGTGLRNVPAGDTAPHGH